MFMKNPKGAHECVSHISINAHTIDVSTISDSTQTYLLNRLWYVLRFSCHFIGLRKNELLTSIQAYQTPKQKAANARFAKSNVKKQGKPRKKSEKIDFPISKTWVLLLVFLVCGGAVLELIRMFF